MKEKGKKTKTERSKGVAQAIVKVWELNGFAARFAQLICKASLILKSLILYQLYVKRKRIIRVKACCSGVWMFKKIWLVILFDMCFNPCFKMSTSFAIVARATASTSEFIY